MGKLIPVSLLLLIEGLNTVVMARYSITAAYVVCFYDWIISLDQEIALIYPSPWSSVKVAYLFCRFYSLAIAPFHLWGLLGDHEQGICQSYYHALYACTIPTMFSAQFILMARTYAFSGKKKWVLAALSVTFFVLASIIVWVTSTKINLFPVFIVEERSGCFAISDQPIFRVVPTPNGLEIPSPTSYYHIGLISILSTSFDGLNMFIMIWHCIRERGTLGPLGQSFLKQGVLVYVVMTALNTLTIGTYFSASISPELKGIGPWFAYVLPSALACRLVLMLRQKASPTETKLRVECSHLVNEALEMIPVECLPEYLSNGSIPSTSTGAQAFL
ncbi:hypothetical protein V8E53_006899 [Lactarius tabidus]